MMKDTVLLIAVFIPVLVIYYWTTKAVMTKWFKFCWRKQLPTDTNESTNNNKEDN